MGWSTRLARALVCTGFLANPVAIGCTALKDDAPRSDAAAPDDAGLADARPRFPVNDECDPNKPFGAPAPLDELNSNANDYDARLSADERTVYFASSRDATVLQIYVATRATVDDRFGAAQLVEGVKFEGIWTFAPSITDDGRTLFFNYWRTTEKMHIWQATRDTATGPFSSAAPVAYVNSGFDDANPMVTPDGAALYFYSTRERLNFLYSAPRLANGSFGSPAKIPVLDEEEAHNVAVSADQRIIAFSSSRGGTTRGRDDIWMSTRASADDAWDEPQDLMEVNSAADDNPTWISANGCRLYMQSNRESSDFDLYVATRPK